MLIPCAKAAAYRDTYDSIVCHMMSHKSLPVAMPEIFGRTPQPLRTRVFTEVHDALWRLTGWRKGDE